MIVLHGLSDQSSHCDSLSTHYRFDSSTLCDEEVSVISVHDVPCWIYNCLQTLPTWCNLCQGEGHTSAGCQTESQVDAPDLTPLTSESMQRLDVLCLQVHSKKVSETCHDFDVPQWQWIGDLAATKEDELYRDCVLQDLSRFVSESYPGASFSVT